MSGYLDCTRCPNNQKVFVVLSYLSPSLKRWVNRKQRGNGTFHSFEEFAAALTKKFIDPLGQDHLRDKLKELRYSKEEGMKTHGDDFLDIAEKLEHTTPNELIYIFKESIPKDIRFKVTKKGLETLEEAIEATCIAAEKTEGKSWGAHRKQSGNGRRNRKHHSGSSQDGPVPIQLDALH
uniref:Retrotransposon gag domain-containing protein n=1 Tax=Chromera velia CCMP2878 TaxID=1169474 RepID=A0A0G4HV29_9ALVE|eukprot:Cvel_8774.t1-p1 / transcript=Cvel_8774.t1 / gene=Cvel_8774 / organism=Chromera_velia_CCMP2878 / gene_product=hypothetical protein / transcript_product=hypothetical protein / location=Cvel_scaffold490:80171-80704(+) / protein_length=178 / sequence_SO=supercontig / SO=protein_coding / is_pseudo=false